MASETKTCNNESKNPKKVNLLDHNSLKHIIEESTTEVVKSRGYKEDARMSNVRLLMGTSIIIIALVAQFYPKKFPVNQNFVIGCVIIYILINEFLQLIIHTKGKNTIMFTYPQSRSYNATGLTLSSKLPRFSDMYTLTIESADPKSISANKPVELTKSITKWFTKDGVLVEGLFWKDVEGLIDEYNKEPKNK